MRDDNFENLISILYIIDGLLMGELIIMLFFWFKMFWIFLFVYVWGIENNKIKYKFFFEFY